MDNHQAILVLGFLVPWLLATGWAWSFVAAATMLRARVPISERVAVLLYIPWALGIYTIGVVLVLAVANIRTYRRGETHLFPDWNLLEARVTRAFGYEREELEDAAIQLHRKRTVIKCANCNKEEPSVFYRPDHGRPLCADCDFAATRKARPSAFVPIRQGIPPIRKRRYFR